MLCATRPFILTCPGPQFFTKLLGNTIGFNAANVTRLLTLPQPLCSLAGESALFVPGQDFCHRWDITGNHCRDRFEVPVRQTRSGFYLIVVHKRKELLTRTRAAKRRCHYKPK